MQHPAIATACGASSDMKWVLFAMMCWLGVPLMTLASAWRPLRTLLTAGLVASTVVKISVNFCSMAHYRGADRGFEVGLTDLIAVSLAMGLVCFDFRRVRWIPFNTPLLIAFFASLCISTYSAASPLLASFTLVKVAKSAVIYWTIYNVFHIDRTLDGFWWGAVGAASILTLSVGWQKYGQGLYRAHGTFDHSNAIPAYSILLIPFLLSWLLHVRWRTAEGERGPAARNATAGSFPITRCLIALAGLFGLCFCVVATLSRAGAVVMAGAVFGTVIYALIRRPITWQRGALAAMFGVCMLVGAAKSYDTLVARFLYAPAASHDARKEFNRAAAMMASDHVFGVGLNCYSRVLTDTPEYRDHIEVMSNESQAGVCHHIYWLTAAETGWIGATLFGLLLARFWLRLPLTALAGADFHRMILLSLLIGIAGVHLIGLYEWVFRITPVYHLFVVITGLSVALAEQLDLASQPRLHNRFRSGQRRGPSRDAHRPPAAAGGTA